MKIDHGMGGKEWVRDDNALEGALGRPYNTFAYGKPDLPASAAAYTHGTVINPPFDDGNKRVAFILWDS
jgi:death-on-curing protein